MINLHCLSISILKLTCRIGKCEGKLSWDERNRRKFNDINEWINCPNDYHKEQPYIVRENTIKENNESVKKHQEASPITKGVIIKETEEGKTTGTKRSMPNPKKMQKDQWDEGYGYIIYTLFLFFHFQSNLDHPLKLRAKNKTIGTKEKTWHCQM